MFNNIYKNRKVLITGHTGFKGSWLVAWLQQLGANIEGIALEPNTTPSHFAILKPNIKTHICDIRNYQKIASIIKKSKPEIIFHLAAQPLVRESYNSPLYTFETNVMGTAYILESSKNIESLKAIIIITSDKCYKNNEWVWGYREVDPLGGYDPYSASKAAAEIITASYRDSFFHIDKFGKEHRVLVASARSGNVIGGGDWSKDRLIPDVIRATIIGKKTIIRHAQAVRPWQHVLEALSGYLSLGEKLISGDKTFADAWNFAPTYAEEISVLKITKKMQKFWPKISFVEQKIINQPHETHYLKLDSSKARLLLKWKNIWGIEQTLRVTTEWYSAFYKNQKVLTLANINEYVNDAKKENMSWML